MYTKTIVSVNLFNRIPYTVFYKDGCKIAERRSNEKSFQWKERAATPVIITRNQAFRYWEKYFPGRSCYDLPEILEKATELDDRKHTGLLIYSGGDYRVEWKEDY